MPTSTQATSATTKPSNPAATVPTHQRLRDSGAAASAASPGPAAVRMPQTISAGSAFHVSAGRHSPSSPHANRLASTHVDPAATSENTPTKLGTTIRAHRGSDLDRNTGTAPTRMTDDNTAPRNGHDTGLVSALSAREMKKVMDAPSASRATSATTADATSQRRERRCTAMRPNLNAEQRCRPRPRPCRL